MTLPPVDVLRHADGFGSFSVPERPFFRRREKAAVAKYFCLDRRVWSWMATCARPLERRKRLVCRTLKGWISPRGRQRRQSPPEGPGQGGQPWKKRRRGDPGEEGQGKSPARPRGRKSREFRGRAKPRGRQSPMLYHFPGIPGTSMGKEGRVS